MKNESESLNNDLKRKNIKLLIFLTSFWLNEIMCFTGFEWLVLIQQQFSKIIRKLLVKIGKHSLSSVNFTSKKLSSKKVASRKLLKRMKRSDKN